MGIYRCLALTDSAKHGDALQINGLEATNSNAKARLVILHKADYVSQTVINEQGYLGHSEGCFAVENYVADTLVSQLKNGLYIIVWKM